MPERQFTDRMTQPLNDAELVSIRTFMRGDPHTGTKPAPTRLTQLEREQEAMHKIMYGDASTKTDGMLSTLKRIDEQNEKTNWNLEHNRKQTSRVLGVLRFIGFGGLVAIASYLVHLFTS